MNVVNIEQMQHLKLYSNDDIVIRTCTSMNMNAVMKQKNVDVEQLMLIYPDSTYADYCPESVSRVHKKQNVYLYLILCPYL